jgi:hypothetical protein
MSEDKDEPGNEQKRAHIAAIPDSKPLLYENELKVMQNKTKNPYRQNTDIKVNTDRDQRYQYIYRNSGVAIYAVHYRLRHMLGAPDHPEAANKGHDNHNKAN